MSQSVTIAGREIGPNQPAYLVAELSGNHQQRFEEVANLVRAAAAAGSEAVKVQTYTADTLTLRCDQPYFKIGDGTLWDGRTLHDLYSEASMPWEWQPFVVRDVQAGEVFTAENVRSIRPSHGLPPKHLPNLLGQRAARDLSMGTPLSWDMIASPASAAAQSA